MVLWVSSPGPEGPLAFLVRHPCPSITFDSNTFYYLAAMGAAFAFTESFVANERRKDDALNGAAGGCAAGFLAGIRCRSCN